MIVLFDLPVGSKPQKKRASRFRLDLLDLGFDMVQFSVYMRVCATKEVFGSYSHRIRRFLPPEGKVQVIGITDKQYESILAFSGRAQKATEFPEQYSLF
jgi:CRISPR-associated protein Cas2